jgi:PucR family transcriptional regulator, purine catabolism regulatory protein
LPIMQVSVEDVLNLPILSSSKVLTAKHTLATRPIELVSFIEAPVDIFEREKELILTTGIGFQDDITIFKKFVKDLIDARAAALIIACGMYVKEVPDEIISLAEQFEFPIIKTPWEVRVGHITRAVLAKIHNNNHYLDKKSKEMQAELLRLFLHDAKLSDALNVIFKNLNTPMALIDSNGAIKESSILASELIDQWNGFMNSLTVPFTPNMLQLQKYFTKVHPKWYRLTAHPVLLIPIQSIKNTFQGYLLMYPQDILPESVQDHEVEQLLDYASTSLALWFQREYSIIETEMRLRGDFILTLAKGLIDSWDMAVQQAKSMGYHLTIPYVCMIGLPKNMNELIGQQNPDQDLNDDVIQRTILSIENQIYSTGDTYRKKTLFTYYQDKFIIYLEPSDVDIKKGIDSFLDLAEEKLQNLLPGIEIAWGIDDQPKLQEFHKSFNNAQIALNIGLQQKDVRQRYTFSNVGLYKVLLSLNHNPDMKNLISSTIGKLIEHDQHRSSDLIKTLSIYIQNLGNTSQTARDLYIHRQSLLYRIQKIESLTGLSLDHPDDFLTLNLSLKFWTMGMSDSKTTKRE